MSVPRTGHQVTLLSSNGRVLVTGGNNGSVDLRDVERYDPASGSWVGLAPMSTARVNHSATELSDGRVLVAGGTSTRTAEIYNRTDNRWTLTGAMNRSRQGHRAVRLSDGRVLVADGVNDGDVYNPRTNSWSSTGAIDLPEASHTYVDDGGEYGGTSYYVSTPGIDGLVPLPSGGALGVFSWTETVVPGCPGSCGDSRPYTKVMRYSSATNTWTEAANLSEPRIRSVATLLSNGRVLVTGGDHASYYDTSSSSAAEVYDPSTNRWYVREPMGHARGGHTGTLLADGRVLISGGEPSCCPDGEFTASELYDPEQQRFVPAAPISEQRSGHGAVRLNDGRVLIAGGSTGGG